MLSISLAQEAIHMMVPLSPPLLTVLHGCLFQCRTYDAGFAFMCFAFNVIGWRCAVVGFETEYHSKFTIIVWHNAWTWEGTCMESFGSWKCDFGLWLVRVSKWLVRVASSSWPPGTAWLQPRLPAWVAPYVNRNVDFTAYGGSNVWHVISRTHMRARHDRRIR